MENEQHPTSPNIGQKYADLKSSLRTKASTKRRPERSDYLEMFILEMHKSRLEQEKANLNRRISVIDADLDYIENEKLSLKKSIERNMAGLDKTAVKRPIQKSMAQADETDILSTEKQIKTMRMGY